MPIDTRGPTSIKTARSPGWRRPSRKLSNWALPTTLNKRNVGDFRGSGRVPAMDPCRAEFATPVDENIPAKSRS
jgi:hypothetical protein